MSRLKEMSADLPPPPRIEPKLLALQRIPRSSSHLRNGFRDSRGNRPTSGDAVENARLSGLC